ncbi:uncharacterized protein LOC109836896 [Asparagus officinalis]|uniref:uncharacterized protein LOC109836896 n=1 Tax=Asparagus officinalis TaxID=4686 RepID=UPI00098E7D8A|nr:uncharacterized protein LOC109836896 [Asparagus officinalis]
MVLEKKALNKWRMCVVFTDLNKACPKYSYPLPRIDWLVDGSTVHKLVSFMDDFSGYNQIYMEEHDQEKTSFITDQGTYCDKLCSSSRREEHPEVSLLCQPDIKVGEFNYPLIENALFILVTTARRLCLYFQAHSIIVRASLSLKKVLGSPNLFSKEGTWEPYHFRKNGRLVNLAQRA